MPKKYKSKNNGKYFSVIPKPKTETLRNETALERTMTLARLVRQRSTILDESREIRQKLYNVSQEIHTIETDLANLFYKEDI